MDLLAGKNAVITGCNRGIGKAILEAFVKNGANVYAVIRKENIDFSGYCRELETEYGVWIKEVYADFSSEEEVKTAAKQILSDKLPIDVLVNNVGVGLPLRSLAMTKMETIHEVFQVNYFSHMLLTQLVSKNMMRNKAGSIVFLASSAAFDGGANIEYCASKAALIGAVKRIAVELGGLGIRCNAIAPGLTETEMGLSMSEEDIEIAKNMNTMKRLARPEEIANTAVFLGSDLSTFTTAQVLRVDGGLR